MLDTTIVAGSTTPTLSVIVPCYDVALYLEACLQSIQRQSLDSIEVIIVDDGSNDGTGSIAQRFLEGDPRFQLVTQANAGCGPARNNGAASATGQFITFIDGDDLVSPFGFERLTASLSRTGSALATGSALRFNTETGFRPSWLHRGLFVRERSGVSVSDHPELARDRMVWNKVFRRDFWESGAYEFPLGGYQDYPISVVTLLDAPAVDVITAPVYFWRERETGDSTTQRAGELGNITERVESDEFVIDVLDRRLPAALAGVRAIFAETDLRAVSQAFESVDDPNELLPLAKRLLAIVGSEASAARPCIERLQHAAIEMDNVEFLVAIARVLTAGGRIPTTRLRKRSIGRRHLVDDIAVPSVRFLPFELRRIPVAEQLPQPVLHSARLDGTSIELRGAADLSQVDGASEHVVVRLSRGGWSTELEVATVEPNPAFGIADIGFSAHVPLELLDSLAGHTGALRTDAAVVRRQAPIRALWPGSGQFGPGCVLPCGVWAQLSNVGDGVGVNWRHSPIFLETIGFDSGRLVLRVRWGDRSLPGRPGVDDLQLLIRRPSDSAPLVVAPASLNQHGGEFALPFAQLASGAAETLALSHADGWSIWLRCFDTPLPILWPAQTDPIGVSFDHRDLLFTRTATNSLQVCDLPFVPVVSAVTLDDTLDTRTLTVSGTSRRKGPPTHWRALDDSGAAIEVPCGTVEHASGWTVSNAIEDLRPPSRSGLTEWRLVRRHGDQHELVWVAPAARAMLPLESIHGGAAVVIDPHNATLRLRWWEQ